MSDIVLRSTTRAGVELRGLMTTLQRRLSEQDGQDTIEYIGVLLVVAALIGIVVALVPSLSNTIKTGATNLINGVFSGGGGGGGGGGGN